MNTLKEPTVCGWSLFAEPWEMMPNDDICGHVSGLKCGCRPIRDGDDTIVHNAFDRREDFESGRRKLS
jgi:hypothetical protein